MSGLGRENAAYMGSGQVATLFQVSRSTVHHWAEQGLLPHTLTDGGRNRRYLRADIAGVLQAWTEHADAPTLRTAFTTNGVARLFSVHHVTVAKWERRGVLTNISPSAFRNLYAREQVLGLFGDVPPPAPGTVLLTPAQAQKILMVSGSTLKRWADTQLVHPVVLPFGDRRYDPAEIRRRARVGAGR